MADPVYYSIAVFIPDGVKTVFEFDFTGGYIDQSHVKAGLRDEFGTITPLPYPFNWVGPNQIEITPALPIQEQVLVIYRDTPKDLPLVDFTDGSIINELNLDTMAEQAVFIAAEMVDNFIAVEAFSVEAIQLSTQAVLDSTEALALANQALINSQNAMAGVAGAQLAAIEATDAANAANEAAAVATAAVNTVLGLAQDANDNAAEALTTANGIAGTANEALATANAASATANAISATANEALGTANTAETKADAATIIANDASAAATAASAVGNAASDALTAHKSSGDHDTRYLQVSGDQTLNGDLRVVRPSSTATGVVYLGDQSGGSRYVHYDGATYNFPGVGITAAGDITSSGGHIKAAGNVYSGTALMTADGNVNGSLWGGWLSNHLNSRFAGRVLDNENSGNKGLHWNGGNFFIIQHGATGWHQLWTNANLPSPASAGAQVQHNSGVQEFGYVATQSTATVNLPGPWVMVGLKTDYGDNRIYLRGVWLRNQ